MVHRLLPGIVQPQHLPGHGQGIPADGIHEQEFFFYTKCTHMLSVTDIRNTDDHESVSGRGPTAAGSPGERVDRPFSFGADDLQGRDAAVGVGVLSSREVVQGFFGRGALAAFGGMVATWASARAPQSRIASGASWTGSPT